jgi:hypothetical protein
VLDATRHFVSTPHKYYRNAKVFLMAVGKVAVVVSRIPDLLSRTMDSDVPNDVRLTFSDQKGSESQANNE